MIKITRLMQTSPIFPTQWEGYTSDGKWVYIRYRWEELTLGVGETLREAVLNTLVEMELDELGELEAEDMMEALADSVDWSEVVFVDYNPDLKGTL